MSARNSLDNLLLFCYNRLMTTQEERPKNARTKRQLHREAGDVILPGVTRNDPVHGYPILPDTQPVVTVRDSLYDLIPLGP